MRFGDTEPSRALKFRSRTSRQRGTVRDPLADPLIAVDCDKKPSVSSNPGEGDTLAGLRKVSCRLLLAAEQAHMGAAPF